MRATTKADRTIQTLRHRSGRAMLAAAAVLTTVNVLAAEGTPTATRRVVVSIPDRKLALIENDRLVRVYPVAVGAPVSPSPVGTFTIVSRVSNPTYYKPGKVVGPGAANPIGTRWIGLSEKGYGIHGTDNPKSIGFAQSHGCIRLSNGDVERLFERVRAGDVVEIHAERTADVARLFGLAQ
jgi:lipoprotein-anchoring transpeptidase ErfK/SrfK